MAIEVARNDGEVRRLLERRPLLRVQQFAERLGWRGLRQEHVWFREPVGKLPADQVVVYYTTTDIRFHLQINESPSGQWETYRAAVIAERYGLLPTKFHEFRLADNEREWPAEVARLAPFLARANFKNKAWRSELRRTDPDRFYPPEAIGCKRKRK